MILPIEQTWLILVDLLTDLKRKGVDVPNLVNKDISLLKTSINFYKRDTTHPDMIKELERVNIVISKVQDELLTYAEEFGEGYQNSWIDKLRRANHGEEVYKEPDSHSKFLSGAPPGFSSAKIHLKTPIAEDRVQEIAEYNNIIIEFEDDVTIALYGDSENIKVALREFAPFFNE
ncbi:hypothetical protein MBCUT_05450 [Methanobrevibacter cuticularis]|uniref:DUF2096 domain-containing protein n=1 Tax=Methanobrevibacter cuticularis TaxID=47311 RepID=A0A166EMW8_9EURY|nr:DUF2096 domain-containing protein [Methanobrevibacter cuticularis]KZX16826.1 hypothetical protein MBCUT_05450 [Methanobrevibacter cuticularis]